MDSELALELGQMQDQLFQKDQLIRDLCTETANHLKAYADLHRQREMLYERVRNGQAELELTKSLLDGSMEEKLQLQASLEEKEEEARAAKEEVEWYDHALAEERQEKGALKSKYKNLERRYHNQKERLKCMEKTLGEYARQLHRQERNEEDSVDTATSDGATSPETVSYHL